MAFDINAQIILSGPKGLTKVRNKIKKDLSSVSVPVKLDFDKGGGKALRDINSQINTLNKSFSQFNSNAQKVSKSIKQAGDNSRRSISNVNSLANTTANLSKNLSKASKDAKKAATEIEAFGKDAALAIRRFSAFTLATGAVFGFVRAVQDGISKGIEFERQIVRLQQVTGSSKAQVQSLDRAIGNLASTLGISQIELAQTAVTLAQTGQSIREVEQSLRAISKASLAPTFGDIKSTTEGVIAALRQFNISASKTEEVLGSLNNVAKRFAVESEDLVSVIRRAGGVFAQASQDIQQGPQQSLNELLAIFTSVRSTTRETADTIATGLRTIFSRLQRKSTIEFLKSFDIQLLDSKDNFIGFFNSFREISTKLEGLGTIELAQVVEELGGIRQIGKILPAIKNFGSVTENAFKVAQQGAKQGLSKDVARATDTLSVKISALSENFSTLIKNITQSKTFQTFAKTAVSVANGFIKTVDALRPLLPLLATLGGIKLIDLGGEFFKGFKDGITKTKDIIDKTEEALDSINKKGGGDSSSGGGGGGGGKGPIGPDSKLLDSLKGNTTALTSNTQALIRNSNLLDKLTRLGIGSNVAKVSDEKSKKKTADQAIAAIPTDPAEALLQNVAETQAATTKKTKEEFQQIASNAEKKKFIRERAGSKESAVQIPVDAKALAAETTKALKEANRTQALTTSNRNKAKFSGVGASRVGGEAEVNAITTQISNIKASNEKLTEALVELQVEFSNEKGELTAKAGTVDQKGSAARKIEKLTDRIARNQDKIANLETKRDNVAPLDIAAIIAETKSAISEKEKSEAKAKEDFETFFAKAGKTAKEKAAQEQATKSLRDKGFVGIPNAVEGNRKVTGDIIKAVEDANIVVDVDLTTGKKLPPQEPVEPIVVTAGSDIDDKRRLKNTSTPVGNLNFGFQNRKVEEVKQKRLTTEESSTSRGVKTRKRNEEEREKLEKQTISTQKEISNSYSQQQAINESITLSLQTSKTNAQEIARNLDILRKTTQKAPIIIPDTPIDTGAGQNTSESSQTRIIGTDASGNIQRERSFNDFLEEVRFESDLRKKSADELKKASKKLEADQDDYILNLGKLYETDTTSAVEAVQKASAKIEATESPTPNIPIAKVNTADKSVFEGGTARPALGGDISDSIDKNEQNLLRVISIKFNETTGQLEKFIQAVGEPIEGEPIKELSDAQKKFLQEQEKIYDKAFPDRNVPGLELGEDIAFPNLFDQTEEGFKKGLKEFEDKLKSIADGAWLTEVEKALSQALQDAIKAGISEEEFQAKISPEIKNAIEEIDQKRADFTGLKKFAKGGFVKGPSHSQGGVQAELEGGEFVVPKKDVDQKTGLPKFENGGSFDDLPEAIKEQAAIAAEAGKGRVPSAVGLKFGRGKGSAANQKAVLTDNIIVDNKPEETGALIGPSEKNNTGLIAAEGNVIDKGLDLIRKINADIVIPEGIKKANLLARGGYGAFGFKETAVDGEGNLTFGGKKEKGRSNAIFDQMKEQINTFSSNLVNGTVPLLNDVLGLTDFFKPISVDSGNVLDEKIIQETFNSLKGAVSESLASVISGSELQGGQESFDLKDLDSAQSARLSTFFESPPGADVTQLKKAEIKANLALARAADGGLVSKVVNEALSNDEFIKRFEIFSAKQVPEDLSTTPFEIQDEKSRGGLTFRANSLLTPGELVFNPKLAEKIGLQNLKKFNRTGDSSLIRNLLGSDISKIATVPGEGNKDTFPATLDKGSFVIKKASSEKSGLQNLNTGGLFGVQSFQNGGQSSGGAGFDTAFFSELAKNVGKATVAFGSLKSVDFSNIGEVISIVPILSAGLEGLFDSFSDATDALLSDEEQKVAEKIEAVDGEIASVEGATEATEGLAEAASEASEAIQELPAKIEKGVNDAVAKLQNLQAGADPSSLANENKAAKSREEKVSKREFQGTAEKPGQDEIDRRAKVKDQRAERNEKRKNLTRQERRELIANDPSRRIRKQDAADRATFDKDIAEAETRAASTSPAEARKGKRDLVQLKQNKQQFFNLSDEARLGEKGFNLKKGDKNLGRVRRNKKGLLSFDDLLPKLGGGGKGKGGLKGIFSKLAGKITSSDKSKSFASDIASKGVSKVRDAGFRGIPEDLFGDGLRDGIKKLAKKDNFKKISKGFFSDLVDQFKDPKKLKGAFKKGKSIPGIIAAVLADPIINTIGDKVGLKEIGGAKGFESGSTVAAGAFGAASGAAKGAAIGAGIGSLIPIPVVGTVVGAIGGAIVGGIDGLFSGIKDQKIFNALSSLDKAAKAASEALGDLGDVEKLDINKDQEKIGEFLTAQEKLTSSVVTTSKKLDEIENGGLKAAEGGEGGIPGASVIGGVLGGPVGASVGAAIDLAESKTISSAFASSEEALTGWSQSLKENSGNKIAQFLQPFVSDLGDTSLSLKEFTSSIEDAITQSSLYQNTIGALNSITSTVSGAFNTVGSVINQQGITGAASTAIGGGLSFATAGISDEIKGLFTGQSGQEVADDRIASVQGAVFLDQQTQAVESFITSVNLLDTEKLKETGDALQQLGAKSLDSIFALRSSAEALAELDLSDIEDFNDLENSFKGLDKNSEQTARIFKNIATNAAQLEAADLEKALSGIAGEDADFKEALKPFQQANSEFLSTLQEGGDIRKASKARADNLLATLGAKIGTKGGVRDIVKGVQITERDERGRAIKDEEGNVVTKAADASNLDDVFAAIEQILAAGDKADPEKLAAVTAALGGNASEAGNVLQALKANTGAQQDQTFAQVKATLAEKQRDEQIRSSLRAFDAFGTAIDKLNKGVSSIADKFTTVADNINSEVEKILSGDTSITAGAKFNPFENIDAASTAEIKQGVANISGTIGPGGEKAVAGVATVLDFGKNLEGSFKKLINNVEQDLSTNKVSSGDISASGIRERFEKENAPALDALPDEVREKFLSGLEASVGASRQDGGTIGIKELKESLVAGELTAGIDQFTDQTAAALAEVTNSLNVLNAAVINAANVQSEIAQIETQKRLTIIGQREAFEDRFNKFLNQSVNVREQAEERLRSKLEATVNAGGAGARGAAAAGVGETDVLSTASLSDRRERLQAERESLKRQLGEASGQEGLAGGALQEQDTDQLIKALADNQQALQGTNDALQQLGDDVTQLAAIESELAKLQESQLTGQQKAANLARKLGDAKTPQERQKIIEEANKPIAALGKAKRLAAGEDVGDFSFDELADLLSLDDFTRQQFGVSDEDFANLKQVASTAVGEGIKNVEGGEVLGDAIVRSQDVDAEKQQLLDDAAAIQKEKEAAVTSQANDKIDALNKQFVLLTNQVTTAKNSLAELTKTVIGFRGGDSSIGPEEAAAVTAANTGQVPSDNPLVSLADSGAFSNLSNVTPEQLGLSDLDQAENAERAASLRQSLGGGGPSTSTNAFASIAGQFDPDVVSAANAAFNDGADPADIARSNAIASSLRDGGSNGIAAPNTLSDINALKPDVNKIAQQNAVNKIFEEQPTQQQFLKQTQAERVDRARDKNPLRNRRDSRLGKEIPKALDQGGSVLNDSAEKLLQASQALSGENQFADKVSQAAEKLANLPELKVDLNAQVGTVDVVLNGGALMTSFGEKVKNDVLAAVAEQLKGMQTPDGSLSDPRLS
jgi:TP901 family phage tail tape measure protein